MNTDYSNYYEKDRFRKKMAQLLGLTFDELEEFAEEVVPNYGDANRGKFAYCLQFSDATPQEIKDKIKRLDLNNTVYFNLEEIDIFH